MLGDLTAGLRLPRNKIAVLESCLYMRSQLLRDSDWAGMAHGLEIRLPLVDAFLLGQLAPLLCGPNPPGKANLAATPRQPLPSAILARRKSGFTAPVRDWLMGDADLPARYRGRGLRGWSRFILDRQLGTAS
jgi:asparagine synthase (glutamine-hydrolysing)